ncbi:TPA: DNA mismatch repair endonuclease MutL [Candidatus Falkowbacteria bacterium]|nr:DNA mismatch repair endonuclease MutL [Candidatus Falkowbacteria bacterium]
MNSDSKIKILPPELVNQIAAGEVVERPASVVKELVENCLDAGGRNISIELTNGGVDLIRITDDGSGMSPEDARLSIAQHATSKIKTIDDLFSVVTMGFRGEALASISSVSQFKLTTKQKGRMAATQLSVFDNQIETVEVGAPEGTTIEVKNLFYNIPARKKYLKTAVTEYNHIVDLFLYYVLLHKQINWTLSHNGKVVYQFTAIDDHQGRIFEVLGREVAENLLDVDYNGVEFKIKGFIGRPQIARNNRKLQYLFVNNRPVDEYVIAKQIKDAFATLIPHTLYPVYILSLDIEPSAVDVNVHPRKMEVRFSEPQKIYKMIYRVVAETLDKNELTKQIHDFESTSEVIFKQRERFQGANQMPVQTNWRGGETGLTGQFNSQISQKFDFVPQGNHNQVVLGAVESEDSSITNHRGFKVIGQVNRSYIVVETNSGLKIYDQHASSERVQFEKLKQDWQAGHVSQQTLLLPEQIVFPPQEIHVVEGNSEFLQIMGFTLEPFGGNTYILSAVPQLLIDKNVKEALKELVGLLLESPNSVGNNQEDMPDSVRRVINMMSCRSAVKFGDELSVPGMYALIEALEANPSQYTCVHGRPCVIEYKYEELEKLFKRRN